MGCGVIGGAAAKILSESGAKIVMSDKNERALDKVSLNLSDGRAIAFDASRVEKIENFIRDVVNFDGLKLDGLVYAVDKNLTAPLADTSLELLQDAMTENFFAFIQAVRVFASEGIYNAKSSIVAVSNYASLGADKGQIAYGASKAAMDNAIPSIAKEI